MRARATTGGGPSGRLEGSSPWAAALALLLAPWLAAGAPEAAGAIPEPIGWREPAPLARLFLQLPFEAPELVPPRRLEVALGLVYSNSLLVATNRAIAVDIHVETAQPTASFRYGLGPRVELALSVPFVVYGASFLDSPIEEVERWFGASNAQRAGRSSGVSRFVLRRPDGRGVELRGTDGGIGDAWAGVKLMLAEGLPGGGRVAVRGAVKLPTGRLPRGSGQWDVGGGVLAAWTWSATALRLVLDLAMPGASLASRLVSTRPYGTVGVGVTQRLGARVALHAQASGHRSPLTRSGLGQLDGVTAYVLAGVSVTLSRGVTLRAGVAENVFSPYRGADIAFPVELVARF